MTARGKARFDGFILEVAPSGDPKQDLRTARTAAKKTLGTGWSLKRLGQGLPEFVVQPPSGRRVTVPAAWDLAAALAQRDDIASAEPTFETLGLEPHPARPDEALAPFERPKSKAASLAFEKPAPADCAWSLALCKVDLAWNEIPTAPLGKQLGEGIVVAHPDTGYTRHPEILSDRLQISLGHDFVDDKDDPEDPLEGLFKGHGTGTASVIMSDALGPEPTFVSGVAPLARLIPLRTSTSVIYLSFRRLTEAIQFALDAGGVHVISMSLGGPFPSAALERAIDRAVAEGIILLAAAGNVWPFVVYPALYESVIAVAACNIDRATWSGSAHGSSVDITAPGENVYRAEAHNALDFHVKPGSGTSFAVATAAGACALWLGFHGRDALIQKYGKPGLLAAFRTVLESTANTPARWQTDEYGAGILDAQALLTAPLPPPPPKVIRPLAAGLRMRNDLNLLAERFPTLDRDRVIGAFCELFHTDERGLKKLMVEHGNEVLFHVGTDPRLREFIAGRARLTKTAAKATATAARVAPQLAFKKRFSKGLRARTL